MSTEQLEQLKQDLKTNTALQLFLAVHAWNSATYMWTVHKLRQREKQVAMLCKVINDQGGVYDEFDKIALTELGIVIGDPINSDTEDEA
jgi:hypothetical protein